MFDAARNMSIAALSDRTLTASIANQVGSWGYRPEIQLENRCCSSQNGLNSAELRGHRCSGFTSSSHQDCCRYFACLSSRFGADHYGLHCGQVTDTTGAMVANATVTISNVDTGITNKTVTDSSGNYVVTPLAVGHYSVTVEAPGFKKSVNGGITLNVQDRIGVNVVLEFGQVTETVEVVGAAPSACRRTLLIWARWSKARKSWISH